MSATTTDLSLDAPDGPSLLTVGELSGPALVLSPDTPVLGVEQRLRADPTLRGVVARHRGRWQPVTRGHLGDVLSGAYGYGRALASRQRLGDLLPVPTVVVRAGAALPHAAELALQQLPAGRAGASPRPSSGCSG